MAHYRIPATPLLLEKVGDNCSELRGYDCDTIVIPGLTRNPEMFVSGDVPYLEQFWIPAFGDLCKTPFFLGRG